MRKLATIARIAKLEPHHNADMLEIAKIRGWQVVVKKGEFQEGDLCVYCEIDSLLPEKPAFEFLRAKHFRIKTIRLRGEISQGIAFPLDILPNANAGDWTEGDDATDALGIRLYEPPLPVSLQGDIQGPFPGFIPKTDEERIQNHEWILQEYAKIKWIGTEKLDGTSATFFWKNGEFGVCSRNWRMKDTPGLLHWQVAHRLDLPVKMARRGRNLALQGEIIGPKIQGNRYQLKEADVRFFNAFDLDQGQYLPHDELLLACDVFALNPVPLVALTNLPRDLRGMLQLADGRSHLNSEVLREGLVFRPLQEQNDPRIGRLSFKVISNQWLLEEK